MRVTTKRCHTGSHWGLYDVEVEDGKLVGIQPFADDPHPTPLVHALPSAVYHPSRITQPMVRKGYLAKGIASDRAGRGVEPFVPVSWDAALDLIAAELQRVVSEHGNEAIYASSGWASAGVFHNAKSQLFRFMNGLGGFVNQVTNYSNGAASVIVPHVVGDLAPLNGPLTSWPTIRDHTQLMVMFGGMAPKNAQLSNGGTGPHIDPDWLSEVRRAGVEFVNISPMRDDAAQILKAQWWPICPNTDTALMLALSHTLLTEDLHDRDFLHRYCVGTETFQAYVLGENDGQPKDAEWAAPITGLDADAIRQLARHMADRRTLISVSWSIQRADHGEQPYWAAIALAAMLGQIGSPGGGFGFGYGCTSGLGRPRSSSPAMSLPTGPNGVKTVIPVARFMDMLLNPGTTYDFNGERLTYPDIRLVYWCGGNPFHKIQDLNRLLHAWQKPETIIIHEHWWTPAARRADIVLPCSTTIERNDIGVSKHDGYFFAMHRAIDPVGESRSEYAIYSALAERLGFATQFTEGRSEDEWLPYLYAAACEQAKVQGAEMPNFDAFWEAGHIAFPPPADPPVLYENFRRDPETHALRTPSGRIELFSKTIDGFGYDDCPGHPTWLAPVEWLGSDKARTYPLHLLSNQPSARLHSQLDCGDVSRAAKIADREGIWLHPEDAAARGIQDGDVVRVYNDRGACLAGAMVTDAIRPGVVNLSTGAWFDPVDPATIGSLDKHGNPNVLTIDKGTSKLAQSPTAQTALVEVERFAEELPTITAFELPTIEARG